MVVGNLLYATAFTAGFGAGPLILSVTGIEGLTPFAIGAVLCLLPVAIVLMIRKVVPGIEDEEAVSSFGFVKASSAIRATRARVSS